MATTLGVVEYEVNYRGALPNLEGDGFVITLIQLIILQVYMNVKVYQKAQCNCVVFTVYWLMLNKAGRKILDPKLFLIESEPQNNHKKKEIMLKTLKVKTICSFQFRGNSST